MPPEQPELTSDQAQKVLSLALRGLARSTDGTVGVEAYGEYVFGYRAAQHHREMLAFVLESIFTREHSIVLEPRGAAKTTWGNTILLAWLVAMFPDIRIGLISNTATQALDFSRAIRYTFEANERHREIFGNGVSPSKWRDMEWLHKDSKWHGSKDVTVYAAGCGGAIISKRFDIILCDDILDEENTLTPEAREKVEKWFFQTLMPCLTPTGVVVCLGTRWAEGDLYEKLLTPTTQEGGRGWRSKVVSALQGTEETGYTSYWEEHWPVRKLLSMKNDLGTPLFMCAYMNDIAGLMAGDVFQRRFFQYYTELPSDRHYTTVMGVDLASSEKERADFTARVTTSRDQMGYYYVQSFYQDKREFGHAEFIRDGYAALSPDLVTVENQQFQSTLIQTVMSDYPDIPIEGKRSDVDKTTRARAVAAKYEAHRVFHHISLKDSKFEEQLTSFPKGHDDLVDALGFSMDLGGGTFFFGSLRRDT
jgi:predicted phage terminase large subunit-like protein